MVSCPDPVIAQALVDTAIAFCERSLIVRYTPDPVSTTAELGTYDFDVPTNQEFSRVVYLTANAEPLRPVVHEQLPLPLSEPGVPTHYYVTQNESELTLVLYPTPDAAYSIAMELALRPTRTAQYLEDALYTYWLDALAHGTIARLMELPGQPYSNPQGAVYHARKAAVLCKSARIESNIGRVTGAARAQPRPFV